MKRVNAILGLAAVAIASPLPQSIDAAAVNNAAIPSAKSAPWGSGSETVSYDSKAVSDATYKDFFSSLKNHKRSLLEARTQPGPCGKLPDGYGPSPDPDTAEAFLAYDGFAAAANDADTPSGYVNAFSNLQGSTSLTMGYLGYDTLTSYDVEGCANKCNSVSGCIAFNIYFERSPQLVPADSCPNPPSTTNIKCTYWGAPVGPETATNKGQYANDFHIVNAGSNGYNAQNVNNIPNYSGTYLDSAAINAPSECNTFITSKLFNDGNPFDPARCAAACQAETDYNAQYLGSRAVCRFFNTYVLSKNNVPQGQYCSLYTASWDDSYATNTGYQSGSDSFTVSYSYSYSNQTDPKLNDCTCGIGSSCNTGTTMSTTTTTTWYQTTATTATTSSWSSTATSTSSVAPSTTVSTTATSTTTATTTTSSTTKSTSTSTTTSSSTSTTTSKTTTSSSTTTVAPTTTSTTTTKASTTTTTTPCTTTTTKASTTTTTTMTSTTLNTTTKTTTTTASATPTPKGPCFRVKIKGPSYCNNAYIGLDSAGALSYSATNPTTFYLDSSSVIRTKDGRYGKCPNAKTSSKNGSITFGTSTDPAAVTCSSSGSDVSCKVAGQSVTSLWTSSSQGAVVLGSKPTSGKWDQVSIKVEQASCSA